MRRRTTSAYLVRVVRWLEGEKTGPQMVEQLRTSAELLELAHASEVGLVLGFCARVAAGLMHAAADELETVGARIVGGAR